VSRHNFKFNKIKPTYRIKNYIVFTDLPYMVAIVIKNHCNGEYREEDITTFDSDYRSGYFGVTMGITRRRDFIIWRYYMGFT
jgi:hypothetical protein